MKDEILFLLQHHLDSHIGFIEDCDDNYEEAIAKAEESALLIKKCIKWLERIKD